MVSGNMSAFLCGQDALKRWSLVHDILKLRTPIVSLAKSASTSSLRDSVPRRSVLASIKFITYTEDITKLFHRHELHYHYVCVSEIDVSLQRLHDCVSEVGDWCASRRLQLNASKTELAWFGSRANMQKLSALDCCLSVDSSVIKPAAVVRDLGVMLDSELTMKQHVNQLAIGTAYIN